VVHAMEALLLLHLNSSRAHETYRTLPWASAVSRVRYAGFSRQQQSGHSCLVRVRVRACCIGLLSCFGRRV